MKNILIISSSPRRNGNSKLLCNQFKKGAEGKGHHVDMIRIMHQNIVFAEHVMDVREMVGLVFLGMIWQTY